MASVLCFECRSFCAASNCSLQAEWEAQVGRAAVGWLGKPAELLFWPCRLPACLPACRCSFRFVEGSPFDHDVCRRAGVGRCDAIIIGGSWEHLGTQSLSAALRLAAAAAAAAAASACCCSSAAAAIPCSLEGAVPPTAARGHHPAMGRAPSSLTYILF